MLQNRRVLQTTGRLAGRKIKAALEGYQSYQLRSSFGALHSFSNNVKMAQRRSAIEGYDDYLVKKDSWDSGLACFGQPKFLKTYGPAGDASDAKREMKDFTFTFEETTSHPGGAPNPRTASRDNSGRKDKHSAKKYQDMKEACFMSRGPPVTVEVSSMNKKTKRLIDTWASSQLDARLRQAVVERLSNSKSPQTVMSVSSKSSNSKRRKGKSSKRKTIPEGSRPDTSPRQSAISQTSKRSQSKSDKTKKGGSPKKLKKKLSTQLQKSKNLQRATVSHIPPELDHIISKCQKQFK